MHPQERRKLLAKHLLYILFLIILWLCYEVVGIGCPIYELFDICCPTCGVTRALVDLLAGNWRSYLNMQPFALPLVLAVFVGIHLSIMPGRLKTLGRLYISLTAISNLGWYICSFL